MNLVKHLYVAFFQRFQCTRCYRDFTSRDALKEHKLQPHDPIICPDCQEQFVTRRALWNHKIQKHNPGNLGLPCDLCDRRFVSKTALEEHINTHTGIRSFVCFACSKGFLHRGSLDRHMKRCVDAEDYTCSRCSKSFSSATVLKDHIEGVHDNIAKWACKHCGKKFTWRHSRIRHEEKCNVHNADVE